MLQVFFLHQQSRNVSDIFLNIFEPFHINVFDYCFTTKHNAKDMEGKLSPPKENVPSNPNSNPHINPNCHQAAIFLVGNYPDT